MRSRLRLTIACVVLAALAGLLGGSSAGASDPLPTPVVAKDVALQSEGKLVVDVDGMAALDLRRPSE